MLRKIVGRLFDPDRLKSIEGYPFLIVNGYPSFIAIFLPNRPTNVIAYESPLLLL